MINDNDNANNTNKIVIYGKKPLNNHLSKLYKKKRTRENKRYWKNHPCLDLGLSSQLVLRTS